jgi:hypothetical protein
MSTAYIGDTRTVYAQTTQFSTGAALDATGDVTYQVFEAGTATVVASGVMPKVGTTTGLYSASITIDSGAGFEAGKSYGVRVAATIDGVSAAAVRDVFRVASEPAGAIDLVFRYIRNKKRIRFGLFHLYDDAGESVTHQALVSATDTDAIISSLEEVVP